MENRISLKIDLRTGVIELEAPAENFEDAVAQTKELTASLDFSVSQESLPAANGGASAPANLTTEMNEGTSVPSRSSGSAKRPRAAKTSSGRPGRIGSFEEVRGLLTEQQEIELRQFFSQKAPAEQSHHALVAIVKGEELLNRRGFNYNEIYTLMWLGGVKDLPKALDVVLLRLIQEQMVVRDENGFSAKFVGRNFVEQELPRAG